MSQSVAKHLTRQATGPEMHEYLDTEIYQLCECIRDEGKASAGGALAQIRFIDLFKVSFNLSS